jgi:pimeloyl-ACP methyl ester carboxylesterase
VDLLERLEAAPVMVPLPRVEGGRVDELEVTRHWIVGALFQMLYDARLARQIPGLVAAMAGGDFRPLLQVAGAAAGVLAGLHVGAYLSVLCAEEVPFLSTDARIDTGSIFDGSNARRHMRETCRQWPEAALAADYKDPVTAPVPTLLLSGRLDPTTPPELAAAQAERLSQSHHVVVEGLSHLPTWTSCFTGLIATFVDRGSVHGLPSACEDAAPGR